MAHKLRERISSKLVKLTPGLISDASSWAEVVAQLQYGISFHPIAYKKVPREKPTENTPVSEQSSMFHMVLSYKFLNNVCANCGHPRSVDTVRDWAKNITMPLLSQDDMLRNVHASGAHLEFTLSNELLFKEILPSIVQNPLYGYSSNYHRYLTTVYGKVTEPKNRETIVVEYSSPNIAKPFHAGHLRSTIIGNFISKLYQKLGHEVIRINYLGNWGTQFGLLAAGYEMFGDEDELDKNALKYLLKIYVDMNEKAAEDPTLMDAAKAFNVRLEQGEESALLLWRKIMEKSRQEFVRVYKRLGIEFDVFESESDQLEAAKSVLQQLKYQGLLRTKEGLSCVDISEENSDLPTLASVARSDGTTLYLTRDISAAIARYKKYKFDRMFYVVDSAQENHFRKLFRILSKLGHNWAKAGHEEFHVPFGRIEKMSSRMGTGVLLEDLLDFAKNKMLENMKNSETTKWTDGMSEKAEILGQSAIIIQDLQSARHKRYTFDWDKMIASKGYSGMSLQYAHARLYNLEQYCSVELDVNCSVSPLVEQSAVNLVLHLARYDEVITEAASNLEAHKIVHYLFTLCRLTNAAIRELRVKDEPDEAKAKARLLLYHCARLVLSSGMDTVGLKPLQQF